jgi:uncharacterized membrane protein
MTKARLEAFSDGVIAVIITIMVLELKVPHGTELADLCDLAPIFLCYVLSFIYVGIYWTNHHHLLMATHKINGPVLWANLNLLFWLSLIPFSTAWMGEHSFPAIPVAVYGCILFCCAISFTILVQALLSLKQENAELAKALGSDWKGKLSMVFYLVGIPSAFFFKWLALGCYVGVACMWLIPDRRIERRLEKKTPS